MKIKFDLNGKKRKDLAAVIGKYINAKIKYLRAPSYAYQIGNLMLTKDSEVEYPEDFDIKGLNEELNKHGFYSNQKDLIKTEGLIIELPLDDFTKEDLEKLNNVLKAKGGLIKKAIGADNLEVKLTKDKIVFPWFTKLPEFEEITGYTIFLEKLVKLIKTKKRTSYKEKQVENEKYAFRCFLLSLGFIGDEYKEARKILLKNLEGSSAFKNKDKN